MKQNISKKSSLYLMHVIDLILGIIVFFQIIHIKTGEDIWISCMLFIVLLFFIWKSSKTGILSYDDDYSYIQKNFKTSAIPYSKIISLKFLNGTMFSFSVMEFGWEIKYEAENGKETTVNFLCQQIKILSLKVSKII